MANNSIKHHAMTDSNSKLALITGASGGIGVDFARELAKRGYDLILTARRQEPLEAVQRELRSEYPINVDIVTGDLGLATGARQLFDDVQSLGRPVSVLVNNAGTGQFGMFLDQAMEDIQQTIQVNVASLTVLTRLFAAEMSVHGGGYILNHASFSAIQPPPDYAVYAGTKSYVMSMSLALRQNLLTQNVTVSTLCPGFFDSEFIEHAGHEPGFFMRLLTLKQTHVARAGVSGLLRRKPLIIPSIRYKVFNLIMRCLPRTVITGIADIAVRW